MRVGRSNLHIDRSLLYRHFSTTGRTVVEVYSTQRRTGRRGFVLDLEGNILYDTDDCYDLGDMIASIDLWASAHYSEC